MKKILALLLAVLMLLSGSSALAAPYTGEEVTLRVFGWETYHDDIWDSAFGQWFQENLGNIKIKSEICPSDSSTLINLYMDTGDDMPDIMMYRSAQDYLDKYGDSGRLLDLNDYAEYMPEYQARRERFPHLSDYDTADGETFLIMPCWADRVSESWVQNDALMEKYGLQTPTTWDEMKKCLEIVCEGEGWDGTNATPLSFINWGFSYYFRQLASVWGYRMDPTTIWYDQDKAEWVYALIEYEDVFRQVTEAMAEAYEKGWIHKDHFTMDQATYDSYNAAGNWLFHNHYLDFYTGTQAGKFEFDNWSFFEAPVAGDNTLPYACVDYTSNPTGWCYGISADCKNPEAAAMYLEFITSEAVAVAKAWGVEGITYEVDANNVKSYTEEYVTARAADANAAHKKYGINGTAYYWGPFTSDYAAFDGIYNTYPEKVRDELRRQHAELNAGTMQTKYNARTPVLDEIQKEDIAVITTPVATYVMENIQAFCMGQKDLAEWDAFMDGIAQYGDISWVLDEYNNAEQYPMVPQQADRNYPEVP